MLDYVDHRFRFFGYGSPLSRVWFIGIEEGGAQGSAQGVCRHRQVELDARIYCHEAAVPVSAGGRETSVWRIVRQIAEQSGIGSEYFLSNVAPLARRGLADELEGVDKVQYRKRVIEDRVPALKRLISKYRPRAAIFHGKAGWRDYGVREAFGLAPDDRRVADYPDQGLIFTNFFSRRFGSFRSQDQANVVALLRDWGMGG